MTDTIKFVGHDDKFYDVNITFPYENTKQLEFVNNDMPDENIIKCGFDVLATNYLMCGDYSDFKYIYADKSTLTGLGDNNIILTNIEGNVYVYKEEPLPI